MWWTFHCPTGHFNLKTPCLCLPGCEEMTSGECMMSILCFIINPWQTHPKSGQWLCCLTLLVWKSHIHDYWCRIVRIYERTSVLVICSFFTENNVAFYRFTSDIMISLSITLVYRDKSLLMCLIYWVILDYRHRLQRHTAVINTLESLSVRSMARRANSVHQTPSSQGSCIISCEMENISQVEDVTKYLLKALCLAKQH